jgi:cephalosporin hydroxylase
MLNPLSSWDLGKTWGTFTSGTFHGEIAGVEVQKSDDDLDRYRELVEISQPDVVIETGTRAGGSALWFHKVLGLQVITIDIAPQWGIGQPPYNGPGIEWISGLSSIRDAVVDRVLPLISGKRAMVSLDSDHHSSHVQAEMAIWGPLVTPGCYMVIEDACFDAFDEFGQPDWARVGGHKIPEIGGPLDALRKSGIEHSSVWWRDEALEGLTDISHSPCGWWRKHE